MDALEGAAQLASAIVSTSSTHVGAIRAVISPPIRSHPDLLPHPRPVPFPDFPSTLIIRARKPFPLRIVAEARAPLLAFALTSTES